MADDAPGERVIRRAAKVHVKHVMNKLGASDRTEAVAIALRRGIIQLWIGRLRRSAASSSLRRGDA